MSINILAERMNRGLSSRAAAKEIGVSQAVLLGAERGNNTQIKYRKLIADFYGCKVTDIWPVEDLDGTEARAAA